MITLLSLMYVAGMALMMLVLADALDKKHKDSYLLRKVYRFAAMHTGHYRLAAVAAYLWFITIFWIYFYTMYLVKEVLPEHFTEGK